MAALRAILIAAWCGLTWTVGYVVAPVLFATLESRALAGDIAGRLFRIQAWTSLVIATLLVAVFFRGPQRWKSTQVRLVIAMAACTLIGYFAVQPWMAALRVDLADPVLGAQAHHDFAIAHGAAAVVYLVQSVLGVILVARDSRVR